MRMLRRLRYPHTVRHSLLIITTPLLPTPQGQTYLFFFFFNDTATTEIYTLSLHDALPICAGCRCGRTAARSRDGSPSRCAAPGMRRVRPRDRAGQAPRNARRSHSVARPGRSEEHTSELQSHSDLVCRLLLEKKNRPNLLAAPWRKPRRFRVRAGDASCPRLLASLFSLDAWHACRRMHPDSPRSGTATASLTT